MAAARGLPASDPAKGYSSATQAQPSDACTLRGGAPVSSPLEMSWPHISPVGTVVSKARILALALSFSLAVPVAAGPREDAATAYQRGDYGVAFRLWRPLAEQGDARAQAELGRMYDTGEGVAQNRVQAASWYRKAADQGLADAQTYLGLMYQYGHGVPQDYVQAVSWFRKAADQGEPVAQYSLGYMYKYAQGTTQDYVQAASWYRKAADQGVALAQAALGSSYEYGHGVPQDDVQAVSSYRKDADPGDSGGHLSLG